MDTKVLHELEQKLNNNNTVIGVYGLGYVGLPLALRFAETGSRVLGFDIDPHKVEQLNNGQSYIERLTPDLIQQAQANGFSATTEFARSSEVDALVICVPTPLNQHREPDLSFVRNTLDAILPYLREGQILSLESTTWPGTTEEIILPRLLERGLIPGENFALVYSPEREDPGNANFSTKDIPKVIGGITVQCLELGTRLYSHAISRMVPVSSPRAAEMTKLLENIHRAVNIGLVNERRWRSVASSVYRPAMATRIRMTMPCLPWQTLVMPLHKPALPC